jgi:hypothetical protein
MLDKFKDWIQQRRIYYVSEKAQRYRLWVMGAMLTMMILSGIFFLFSCGFSWTFFFCLAIFAFALYEYVFVRWKTKSVSPKTNTKEYDGPKFG